MDLETLRANSVGISNTELEKQKLLEKAYGSMMEGKALAPDQVSTLNEYANVADKLNKAKSTNMTIESLMDARKVAEDESEEVVEGAEEQQDRNTEKSEDEVKEKSKETDKSKDEGEKSKSEEEDTKEASMMPALNEEEVLLSSLLKDTPSGNYSNTLAKMRAESDLDRENYTTAFNSLQDKGRENFKYLLDSDTELSHPDRVNLVTQNFDLLNEFAPALASNPITARSFLKKMDAYGDQIDEKTIGELIKTNSEFMNHRVRMR